MTESRREEFLAGNRPSDVAFFLHESTVSGIDALTEKGERTGDGVVLVVPGDGGRSAFQSATGVDPMGFARDAMETEGEIDRSLTGGICPNEDGRGHETQLLFAFAEEQNDDVDGLYNEGDVIHAYAACECGQRYSEKWLAGE